MNEYTGPVGSNQEEDATVAGAAVRSVRDKAGGGAQVVADNVGEAVGTAKDQASEVVGEAGAQVRDLLAEARDQVQEQARAQTGRLAENVRRLAHELRDMADHGKPDSAATAAVGQLADGGHQVADRLERRGPDGLLEDVQDFARRRPGVFLAGAALAGFALGRTGKGVAAAGSTSAPGGEGRGGREYPPPVPVTPPSPAAPPAPGYPPASPLPTGGGVAPGPYEDYGQSQPPHVTPAYGQDPAFGRRPPAQGV
ncbi:hypothetical protein [Kitasatospora sp. NPDC005748]|uniref:hypothetical protein n=1 Tax=unclassified Kitasatospora TaxID=2633591 RepID=UPI0033DFA62C